MPSRRSSASGGAHPCGPDVHAAVNAFHQRYTKRSTDSRNGVALIEKLISEFNPQISRATNGKARMFLAMNFNILPRVNGDGVSQPDRPPRFILRGGIIMSAGTMQITLCELGDLEHITLEQLGKVRAALARSLADDEVIHGLVAFALSDEYGHRIKDTNEINSQRMAQMVQHQLDEYERSESWRQGKKDEDEDNTDDADHDHGRVY